MGDNHTTIDGVLVWSTRLQMWSQGFRLKMFSAIVGGLTFSILLFISKPPLPIDMKELEPGMVFNLKDALKLELAQRGKLTFLFPPAAHKVAALPDKYKQAGINYLAEARKTYWAQYKKYGFAAVGGAITFFCLISWMGRRESLLRSEDRYVRGAQLVSDRELNRLTKNGSRLNLAGVHIPPQNEITPWAFCGRPRQGKTVAIKSLLDQVSGLKIIFYSKGDFVKTHFKPGDLIFAPGIDTRSVRWNLFNDVTSLSQISAIAAALIPEPKGQSQLWATGARRIFEGLLLHCMSSAGQKSNSYLWKVCCLPAANMAKLLRNTPGAEAAAALLDKPDTPTAFSFYINLAAYTKPIQLLAQTDGDFNVRTWLTTADHDGSNSLFILSSPDHQEALRPLMTLFLSTLLTAHLSMTDNLDRRVWYLLDELSILPKIPRLDDALNFGPSKGLCAVLGFQSYQQLDEKYGKEIRDALISACGTHVFFSVGSNSTADEASKIIGSADVLENRATLSTGITDSRHGGSSMEQSAKKLMVTADEIKDLLPLHAVLRLLGFPSAKIEFVYKPYKTVAVALDPDPAFEIDRYLLELSQLQSQSTDIKPQPQEQALSAIPPKQAYTDLLLDA